MGSPQPHKEPEGPRGKSKPQAGLRRNILEKQLQKCESGWGENGVCYQKVQVPGRRYRNCPSGIRLGQSSPEEAGARYVRRDHRISQSLLLAPHSAPADPGRQVRKQKKHEINPPGIQKALRGRQGSSQAGATQV